MLNTKKPIKEFGKLYEYLKDHDLREKEQSTGHLDIRDADFSSVSDEFAKSSWVNYIFTNCHFPASGLIQLRETKGCIFNQCEFGPGRNDMVLYFGAMKNCQFNKCKFISGNVGFGLGAATFRNCEFEGKYDSRNGNYFLGGDDIHLISCKFRDFDLLCDHTKVRMKSCDYNSAGHGQLGFRKPYASDLILEDTKIEKANEILWNQKINNLTLRGCQVKGKFSTQQAVIRDSIVLEKLKVGTYYVGQSGTEKMIVVRDCHFSEVNENTTRLFSCSAGYASEALFERVECSNAAACDLTGAGPGAESEDFRLAITRNKTFTLRGCKIPHLMTNWLQTHNLVIEDCEFGKLELKDGRIGNVTIKNTKFNSLDLTNTLAGKFDIQPSGKIVTAGSNYPQGGHKIDGVK